MGRFFSLYISTNKRNYVIIIFKQLKTVQNLYISYLEASDIGYLSFRISKDIELEKYRISKVTELPRLTLFPTLLYSLRIEE